MISEFLEWGGWKKSAHSVSQTFFRNYWSIFRCQYLPWLVFCLKSLCLGYHDGDWLQLLISFLFWPIHGALVSWLIRGVKGRITLAFLGSLSKHHFVARFLSEAHWDCSCIYPDPRRTPELTALFCGAGVMQILNFLWLFQHHCSPSLLWHGSRVLTKEKRFCVFAAFLILPSNELGSPSQGERTDYRTNGGYHNQVT